MDQYSGKTTITNCGIFKEHWSKETSVYAHRRSCPFNPTVNEVKVQFFENVWDRGKESLSEREFLWNKRLKGNINIQKPYLGELMYMYIWSSDVVFVSLGCLSVFFFS